LLNVANFVAADLLFPTRVRRSYPRQSSQNRLLPTELGINKRNKGNAERNIYQFVKCEREWKGKLKSTGLCGRLNS